MLLVKTSLEVVSEDLRGYADRRMLVVAQRSRTHITYSRAFGLSVKEVEMLPFRDMDKRISPLPSNMRCQLALPPKEV